MNKEQFLNELIESRNKMGKLMLNDMHVYTKRYIETGDNVNLMLSSHISRIYTYSIDEINGIIKKLNNGAMIFPERKEQ